MKKLISIACFLIFATLQVAVAEGNPAGVVLYAETAQGVVLLLADHTPPSKRGWSAFGGSHEPGESIADTAARETEEETRGYFKREAILAAIKTQKPVVDGTFSLYFVKVDHVPIGDISKAPIPPDKPTYAERGPYAWIPAAEIERLVIQNYAQPFLQINAAYLPANKHSDWLWPIWVHNMKIAFNEKAIPWKQEKSDKGGETVLMGIATNAPAIDSVRTNRELAAQSIINPIQAWGPTNNGLRLAFSPIGQSVTISQRREFNIAFQNVGAKDIVLSLGHQRESGAVNIPSAVYLVLTDGKGTAFELRYSDRSPGIMGRLDDFTVVLPSGGMYILRLNIANYASLAQKKFERHQAGGYYHLVARFDGAIVNEAVYGKGIKERGSVWTGSVESNILQLDVLEWAFPEWDPVRGSPVSPHHIPPEQPEKKASSESSPVQAIKGTVEELFDMEIRLSRRLLPRRQCGICISGTPEI